MMDEMMEDNYCSLTQMAIQQDNLTQARLCVKELAEMLEGLLLADKDDEIADGFIHASGGDIYPHQTIKDLVADAGQALTRHADTIARAKGTA